MNDSDSLVQFPCTRNCCLNEDDTCLGCFRSLEEITQWGVANDNERNIILQNARQRRAAHDLDQGARSGH